MTISTFRQILCTFFRNNYESGSPQSYPVSILPFVDEEEEEEEEDEEEEEEEEEEVDEEIPEDLEEEDIDEAEELSFMTTSSAGATSLVSSTTIELMAPN